MEKPPKQFELEYKSFIADTGGRCWRCGRTERDKPCWWWAEWHLHPHHIVNHPRKRDRRACIVLCPACHSVQHGGKYAAFALSENGRFINCRPFPLTLEQAIRLKRDRDKDFFDPEFLAAHSIKSALVESICRELESET